ncbi:MAG: MerR family transcriptional regulator [Candidatus Omnitrophica bacterium]|nr:MerR family transcriptional regulator [Candidatus Omnitrophota bacterium]
MNEHGRFYSISEVSQMTGIAEHILRYWETQFPFLKIQRDMHGRRIYCEKDIEKIKHIQKLLYSDGYKIKGVKIKFRDVYKKEKVQQQYYSDFLKKILKRLKEIEKCLS